MIQVQDLVLCTFAYLIGSIPTSLWIGKRFFDIDIRKHGSGNPGASNTWRVMGTKPGLIVLALDMLKGLAAVGLVRLSTYTLDTPPRTHLIIALALAAIVGHIFPIYAKFKGGKGVATAMGIILGINPLVALVCVAIYAVVLLVSHYASLASMISLASFPLWVIVIKNIPYYHYVWFTAFTVVLPLIIILTHRKNILRLINSEENRTFVFGKKKIEEKD
jgi:glycerol-3-phosphate acyltransferase PlsY